PNQGALFDSEFGFMFKPSSGPVHSSTTSTYHLDSCPLIYHIYLPSGFMSIHLPHLPTIWIHVHSSTTSTYHLDSWLLTAPLDTTAVTGWKTDLWILAGLL
ncbi:hypothetical protein STEG23_004600, partial [Scotinomys teguina]